MSMWELVLVALSLAMDAFAVAVAKGLSHESGRFKESRNASFVWYIPNGYAAYWLGYRCSIGG